MIGLERRWNSEKGEWEIGTEYRNDYPKSAHVHPGVTADLKETTYDPRDDSWAAGYAKINEDTRKENLESAKVNENPFLTLRVQNPYTNTITYNKDDPFIVNSYHQIDYKYNEDRYLGELRAYIDATYGQHYSQNQFQATEFIIDGGHGTGFCIGNVLKYAQRYGRKGTPDDWRKDLLKVIHYAVIQLHVHDLENSNGDKK